MWLFKILTYGDLKPKIEKINSETINTNGTSFQGDLYASYNDIVSKLGEPLTEKLCYKSDAEWVIEFEKEPQDLSRFCQLFDEALQNENSDYETFKKKIIKYGKESTFPKLDE